MVVELKCGDNDLLNEEDGGGSFGDVFIVGNLESCKGSVEVKNVNYFVGLVINGDVVGLVFW